MANTPKWNDTEEIIPEFEQTSDINQQLNPPQEQQLSQLEAAGTGLARGGTLGLSDELAGLLGGGSEYLSRQTGGMDIPAEAIAKNLSPEVLAKIKAQGGKIEGIPAEKKSYSDLYKEYRDLQRARQTAAKEQYPKTEFASEMAGGFALPAGETTSFIGKGANLGQQIVRSALAGAATGGLVGGGESEAELMKPNPDIGMLGEDIKQGAKYGAALGGAFPVLAKGAQKLSRAIKNTDAYQNLLESYRRGKMGQLLNGPEARKQATAELVDTLKSIQPQMKQLGNDLNTNIENILKDAEEKGITINVADDLNGVKQKLQSIVETSPDPTDITEAKQLMDIIDNQLQGKEVTRLVPAETGAQKAMTQMQQKRAGIQAKLQAGEPTNVAEQKILTRQAKEQAQTLGTPPEFTPPEQVMTEANKPAMVSQKLTEEGTQNIADIIQNPDLTDIQLVKDPESNLSFLQFHDKNTGKVYQKIVPENEITKYKKVIERVNPKPEVSPTEIRKLRQTFQKYTPFGSKPMTGEGATQALDITNKLGETVETQIPGVQQANQAYADFMNALDSLGISRNDKAAAVIKNLGPKIDKIAKDTAAGNLHGAIMDEFIGELQKADPNLAGQLSAKLKDVATRMDLAYERMAPALVAGKSGTTLRTGLAGAPIAVGNIAGRTMKAAGETVRDITPEFAQKIAAKLSQRGDQSSSRLAAELRKVPYLRKRARQAILFNIMQNPQYRELIRNEQEQGLSDGLPK